MYCLTIFIRNNSRKFSSTNRLFVDKKSNDPKNKVDPDKILAEAKKYLESLKAYSVERAEKNLVEKTEPNLVEKPEQNLVEEIEKNFIDKADEKLNELLKKQDYVDEATDKQIKKALELLSNEESKKIETKYYSVLTKEYTKISNRNQKLEEEFPEGKSVAYFQKKIDIETSSFKKLTQIKQQEENEVSEKIKENCDSETFNKYNKERLEWKIKHIEDIKSCRSEKQKVKEEISSNLEKPSEMAQDLAETEMPDLYGDE